MRTKLFDVKIKAAGDDLSPGQFTGYAAVFGNIDSYGDVILRGAFAETLTTDYADGVGVPCYWAHQMNNPHMNIGSTVEAREDGHGLFVKVQLDLDTETGAQVHRLIEQGRVRQMSFAFDVEDGGWGERDGEPVYELRKLKLHEVSVVPVGANQETELLAVKAALLAARAELAAKGPENPETESSEAKGDTPAESEPDAPLGEQEQVKTGGNPAVVLAHTILKTL